MPPKHSQAPHQGQAPNNRFIPCAGKSECTEGGSHCQGCGRSHGEIAQTRLLLHSLADLVVESGYENVAEFSAYMAKHLDHIVKARRAE